MESEAVIMRAVGAPDVLQLASIRLPWPGAPTDVLLRLEAADVNPADTWFRAYGPYFGDGPGTVLGHEGAGVVEAVGAAPSRLRANPDRAGNVMPRSFSKVFCCN